MYKENLGVCLGIYYIIRSKHIKSKKIYILYIFKQINKRKIKKKKLVEKFETTLHTSLVVLVSYQDFPVPYIPPIPLSTEEILVCSYNYS